MKFIKSNAEDIVTLQFEGEDIVIDPANPIRLTEPQAEFVLKTLGFCEVAEVKVKEEASVPPVPVNKEVVKEEVKEEVKKPKKKEVREEVKEEK